MHNKNRVGLSLWLPTLSLRRDARVSSFGYVMVKYLDPRLRGDDEPPIIVTLTKAEVKQKWIIGHNVLKLIIKFHIVIPAGF